MTKKAKHVIDPELTAITLQYMSRKYPNVEGFDSFDFDFDDYEYGMKLAELKQEASRQEKDDK